MNLPDRSSLDHLRHQARDLQRSEGTKLAAAQRELARRYGFKGWTALRNHVMDRRLAAAVDDALGGRVSPDLSGDGPVVRLLRGDATGIDPAVSLPPRDWPPLLYVLFSRVSTPEARRAAAADLLERGADVAVSWVHPEYPEPPQTPLTASVAIHRDAELTKLLLAAGADPSDGEAMYHGTEEDGYACLRLLLEAGGSPKGANAIAHMLDRDDLPGLDLLLTHYGEPDGDLHRGIHDAIVRGRSTAHVARLVEAGADPGYVKDGVTAPVRAWLLGLDVGLPLGDLSPVEAALAGLSEEPIEIPDEFGWVLVGVASRGDTRAVERLVALGMSPDARGEGGKTPLHTAGFAGHAGVVQTLLRLGADSSIREFWHDGTPLNWSVLAAVHAPVGARNDTLRLLIDAGRHGDPEFWLTLTPERPDLREMLGLASANAG